MQSPFSANSPRPMPGVLGHFSPISTPPVSLFRRLPLMVSRKRFLSACGHRPSPRRLLPQSSLPWLHWCPAGPGSCSGDGMRKMLGEVPDLPTPGHGGFLVSFSGNLSCSASSRVHRLRLAALFCGVVSRLSALDMCWQPSLCLMLFKGLQPSRKVESGSVGPLHDTVLTPRSP